MLPLCTPPCVSVMGDTRACVSLCVYTPAPSLPQSFGPHSELQPLPPWRGPLRLRRPRILTAPPPLSDTHRSSRPAPANLLHAAASYAVFAAPASGVAGDDGPSMRPDCTAPGYSRALAARRVGSPDPRPAPPRPAGPAPTPPLSSIHTGGGTAPTHAHNSQSRARIMHTHSSHMQELTPASIPFSACLGGTVSPEKTPSKGSPSSHS